MREIGWRLLGAALVLAVLAHGAAIAFLLERPEPAGAVAEGAGGMNVSVVAGLPAPAKAAAQRPPPPEPELEPEPKPESAEDLPPEPDALPVLPAQKPVKKPKQPKQVQKPVSEPQPEKVHLKEPEPEPAPAQQLAHVEGAAGKAPVLSGTAAHAEEGAAAGGGATGARADYYALLRAHLERFKQYPRRARLRREEGVVELSLTIGRGGEVVAHKIVASSGFGRLDEAVSRMVADASPLPPPGQMAELPVTVRVPVDFSLR